MRPCYVTRLATDTSLEKREIWRRSVSYKRKRIKKRVLKKLKRLAKKRVLQLKAKQTRYERLVRHALSTGRVPFVFQKSFICPSGVVRVVDFYLPPPFSVALEIDGQNHTPQKDLIREKQIKAADQRILFVRIKNKEVTQNLQKGNKLAEFILRRMIQMAKQETH